MDNNSLASRLADDMQAQVLGNLAYARQMQQKSYARDTGLAVTGHFNAENQRLMSVDARGTNRVSKSISNRLPMRGETRGLTNDGSAILG